MPVWGQAKNQEENKVAVYPQSGMTHRLFSPHMQRLEQQGQLLVIIKCISGSADHTASQWGIRTMSEAYYDDTSKPWDALHNAAMMTHKALYDYVQDCEQDGIFSMTAAVIVGSKLHIIHGGVSTFAYLLCDGTVRPLTTKTFCPIGAEPAPFSSGVEFKLYQDIPLRSGDKVVLSNVDVEILASKVIDKAPRTAAQYLIDHAYPVGAGSVVVAGIGKQRVRRPWAWVQDAVFTAWQWWPSRSSDKLLRKRLLEEEMFLLGERVRRMSWKQRLITAGAGSLTLATLCATVSLISFAARGPVQDEDNVPTPTPRQPTVRTSQPTLVWSTPEGEGTKETPAPTMTPEPRPTVTPIKGD